MIRFRFREDEKRYQLLLAQAYKTIASHVPAEAFPEVFRAISKIENMLLLEGVRQGVAAAAISNAGREAEGHGLESLMAFQLHAHVYGSQDTPLRAVEEEWLAKLGHDHLLGSPWLDPNPMRFAPAVNVTAPHVAPNRQELVREVEQILGDDPTAIDRFAKEQDQAFNAAGHTVLRDPQNSPVYEGDDDSPDEIERLLDEPVQPQPALLNRIREQLLQLASQGYRPGSWDEMIMRLHLLLQVDAGVLDIMLGSPPGRAILDQAGCNDLHPGALGLDLTSLLREIEPT